MAPAAEQAAAELAAAAAEEERAAVVCVEELRPGEFAIVGDRGLCEVIRVGHGHYIDKVRILQGHESSDDYRSGSWAPISHGARQSVVR